MKRMKDLVLVDEGEYDEKTSTFLMNKKVLLKKDTLYCVTTIDNLGYSIPHMVLPNEEYGFTIVQPNVDEVLPFVIDYSPSGTYYVAKVIGHHYDGMKIKVHEII